MNDIDQLFTCIFSFLATYYLYAEKNLACVILWFDEAGPVEVSDPAHHIAERTSQYKIAQ